MNISGVLSASAAIAIVSAAAFAQAPNLAAPATGSGLPPGLIRQGGVIMMQPIGDSDEREPGGSVFGGERRTTFVPWLSSSDHDLFGRAVKAAQRGDWIAARELAGQGHNAVARRLIEWAYLSDRNSGAPFAEIAVFLKDYPDWPGRNTLFARAEEALSPLMEPRAVIAWFGDRTPETGIGKVRLAEALIATGSPERGRDLIRRAWIEDNFEPDQEYYVIAQHGDALTPETDRERLERLLAHNDVGAARREMTRLGTQVQELAEARLALRMDPVRGEEEADALPLPLRDDPGLLFDEAHALRERDDIVAIPALIARASTGEMARLNPGRWWAELNADARDALQQGLYREAYALVADAGLSRDASQYSDAEFLAGWIALRELNAPRVALTHFENVAGAVSRPVSRARAHYWMGRANEAAGEVQPALQEYRAAAADPATFYGQLALARIESNPSLHLPATMIDADGARASYEREDMTAAIRVLADLGFEGLLREFAVHDAELHPDAAHMELMAEDLARMGCRDVAVRVAKQASYGGTLLFDYSHPVISVPRYLGPGTAPENALVLAIIRQETEFDPEAVSGAGARGIMQVMPDSAPHLANLAGLNYSFPDLTGDASYNMELGMTELAHQLSEWDGSYILAAAAYNAGPGNVRKWIAAFGDPRDPRVDPVDWIERIPFDETRNYVQRVIENVEVYRDKLAGRDQPLQILADLYRPVAPQTAPLRVVAGATSQVEPKPRGAPLATATLAPVQQGSASPVIVARPIVSGPDVAPKFKPSP
ncbi:MAG: transglycosylase SLT domain-containing protein [Rhizomicrobium sp.]